VKWRFRSSSVRALASRQSGPNSSLPSCTVSAVTDNAMTAEELQSLRTELADLEGRGREEIAEQIKVARAWGDLKENAEYHAAKEAQAHLETKILKLRDRVLTARVVEVARGDVVEYGSTVEVEDEKTGRKQTYTLVSSRESAPGEGRLSMESPVAEALRGLRAGDVAVVRTPSGERRFKVASVG
jgi:transcription elongation factor GreA